MNSTHEPSHVESQRLDLSAPEAKKAAYEAFPALYLGAALGNQAAAGMCGQILGHMLEEALRPGIEAIHRLQQTQSRNL